MNPSSFVAELESANLNRILSMSSNGPAESKNVDAAGLLRVALANEINVSELAASWMPTTRSLELKLALARQTGDEARHAQRIADRLAELGHDVSDFQAPTENPLFEYLRGLSSEVERVAAGLFTLENLAYEVNQRFISLCEEKGDSVTADLYRKSIQPDERRHQETGRRLLAKIAHSPRQQALARATSEKALEIAAVSRAKMSAAMGTVCLPGC